MGKRLSYDGNPKIAAFIADVIEVGKKHGLSISHEDGHGAFVIELYSDSNAKWLEAAADGTGESNE